MRGTPLKTQSSQAHPLAKYGSAECPTIKE